MTRNCRDWLTAYVEYAAVTEAPRRMHFWSGVSVLAGSLRRKVWLDMKRFKWFPSFYIVFVAPPGVVSKTTTADIGMGLLREIPGIHFGPDIITWPALVTAFAASTENFEYKEDYIPMSAMTLVAGELGNLINPQDREMINLYISLWDGLNKLDKATKTSGSDTIEAPWINMLGCTTPHWIADNMPAAAIGGGFTSRCIFIYADKKETYVPYVDETIEDTSDATVRQALLDDLIHISTNLTGPFRISDEARVWGREWYEHFWGHTVLGMDNQMMEGYAARKQTHLHKTAMILSVSRGDSMVIEKQDLELAEVMLKEIEIDMTKVFSRVGKTEDSVQVERLVDYIRKKGKVGYEAAYAQVHTYFTDFHDFEGILMGVIRAGMIRMDSTSQGMMLVYIGADSE